MSICLIIVFVCWSFSFTKAAAPTGTMCPRPRERLCVGSPKIQCRQDFECPWHHKCCPGGCEDRMCRRAIDAVSYYCSDKLVPILPVTNCNGPGLSCPAPYQCCIRDRCYIPSHQEHCNFLDDHTDDLLMGSIIYCKENQDCRSTTAKEKSCCYYGHCVSPSNCNEAHNHVDITPEIKCRSNLDCSQRSPGGCCYYDHCVTPATPIKTLVAEILNCNTLTNFTAVTPGVYCIENGDCIKPGKNLCCHRNFCVQPHT